ALKTINQKLYRSKALTNIEVCEAISARLDKFCCVFQLGDGNPESFRRIHLGLDLVWLVVGSSLLSFIEPLSNDYICLLWHSIHGYDTPESLLRNCKCVTPDLLGVIVGTYSMTGSVPDKAAFGMGLLCTGGLLSEEDRIQVIAESRIHGIDPEDLSKAWDDLVKKAEEVEVEIEEVDSTEATKAGLWPASTKTHSQSPTWPHTYCFFPARWSSQSVNGPIVHATQNVRLGAGLKPPFNPGHDSNATKAVQAALREEYSSRGNFSLNILHGGECMAHHSSNDNEPKDHYTRYSTMEARCCAPAREQGPDAMLKMELAHYYVPATEDELARKTAQMMATRAMNGDFEPDSNRWLNEMTEPSCGVYRNVLHSRYQLTFFIGSKTVNRQAAPSKGQRGLPCRCELSAPFLRLPANATVKTLGNMLSLEFWSIGGNPKGNPAAQALDKKVGIKLPRHGTQYNRDQHLKMVTPESLCMGLKTKKAWYLTTPKVLEWVYLRQITLKERTVYDLTRRDNRAFYLDGWKKGVERHVAAREKAGWKKARKAAPGVSSVKKELDESNGEVMIVGKQKGKERSEKTEDKDDKLLDIRCQMGLLAGKSALGGGAPLGGSASFSGGSVEEVDKFVGVMKKKAGKVP
ncbi:hypothetical protein JCM11641_007743, partial [Rhodosporidiobolus odoratus]